MRNPDDTTHPATVQADLLDQLTPATVVAWLYREAERAQRDGRVTAWRALVIAAGAVERAFAESK